MRLGEGTIGHQSRAITYPGTDRGYHCGSGSAPNQASIDLNCGGSWQDSSSSAEIQTYWSVKISNTYFILESPSTHL